MENKIIFKGISQDYTGTNEEHMYAHVCLSKGGLNAHPGEADNVQGWRSGSALTQLGHFTGHGIVEKRMGEKGVG